MKKLIFIIIFLIILNIICFNYLKNISVNRNSFIYDYNEKCYILPKKELIIDDIESFVFEEYFELFYFEKPKITYEFDDENIHININSDKYSFNYQIKEKEKEIVEIYIEKPRPQINNTIVNEPVIGNTNIQNSQSSNNQPIIEYTEHFILLNSSLSFTTDTQFDQIISSIYSSFISDTQVHIDYSELNPAVAGTYPVYLKHQYGQDIIEVNIT